MDELDEQLRQLSLINSCLSLTDTNNATLSDNLIDVSKLVNSIEEKNDSAQELQVALQNRLISGHDLITTKKVGPLVPPKPSKKSPNFPEVPQSSLVKQTCEPLYSRRLQSVDGSSNYASTEFSNEPLLLRKQHIYDTQQLTGGAGSLTRKVTLDNPAVLEQQLEALEHHKKQLEKRGKLCKNSGSNNTNKNMSQNFNHRSKLFSSSLLTDVRTKPHNVLKNYHVTYTNTMRLNNVLSGVVGDANSKNNLYCNINSTPASPINNIYSNVVYEKAQQVQECVGERISHSKPQPSTTKPSAVKAAGADDSSMYFSHNGSIITEDEIQPPPSPVSSSYSELRHATEVFKTKNTSSTNVIKSSDQVIVTKPIVGYEIQHDQNLSKASNESRQLYINKPYITNEVLSNNNATTVQAKANPNSSDYYGYGEFSQTSSAYESIYEPINPRPPSQMSSRSNNLAYPTCVNSGSSGIPILPECGGALGKSSSSNFSTLSGLSGISSADSNSPIYPNNTSSGVEGIINNYTENPKESEVESLTDFLVNSMDAHRDLENYGICFKCNERVVGENSGCTAMDQIYHIDCFTCSQCQINLQGKPFYALDCKPYCDFDYLQTLEKCSVCMKPILERILRATGKPYHPQCFTCVVCKKSLDGIPFTVDATNQNYCIEDFHKKFAPRCCVCKEPIMPEPGEEETVRVVALDRSFHFECYKCEDHMAISSSEALDCGLLLSSEAEGRGCYPLDDHVLCKSCNAKRVQMLTNRMTTTEL